MIIFSSPKPFHQATTPVQLSAMRSWAMACPLAKIFLFGDANNLLPICKQEGFFYGGSLPTTELGGEILSGMFVEMTDRHPEEVLLYLNSDIFLEPTLARSVQELESLPKPWLGACRRWCLSSWEGETKKEKDLLEFLKSLDSRGYYGTASALDLFLFRGIDLHAMPPFRIGHAGWDNWMIYHARCMDIPVIDLSSLVRACHCRHDYSYARGNTSPDRRDGPLEEENVRILGRDSRRFHLGHATHEWKEGRVVRRRGVAFFHRQFEVWIEKNPRHQIWVRFLKRIFHPLIKKLEKATSQKEDWSQKRSHDTEQNKK